MQQICVLTHMANEDYPLFYPVLYPPRLSFKVLFTKTKTPKKKEFYTPTIYP